LAKPLYKATKWGTWKPWYRERNKKRPIKKIKRTLTNAPALGLPSVIKPFFLYVHERLGTAVAAARFLALPGGLFIKAT
jgi:hypothetical protein